MKKKLIFGLALITIKIIVFQNRAYLLTFIVWISNTFSSYLVNLQKQQKIYKKHNNHTFTKGIIEKRVEDKRKAAPDQTKHPVLHEATATNTHRYKQYNSSRHSFLHFISTCFVKFSLTNIFSIFPKHPC